MEWAQGRTARPLAWMGASWEGQEPRKRLPTWPEPPRRPLAWQRAGHARQQWRTAGIATHVASLAAEACLTALPVLSCVQYASCHRRLSHGLSLHRSDCKVGHMYALHSLTAAALQSMMQV